VTDRIWPNWGDRSCEHDWHLIPFEPEDNPIWECAKCQAITLDDPETHREGT
jgi:hypothetical protein